MKKDKRVIPLKDGEIIPISFDYHFIRIFGKKKNMNIIEYFISDYYDIPIEEVVGNIEILSRDLPQDSRGEKSKQIDLLLKLGEKKINIEIANNKTIGRKERDLVYLAKIHGQQLRYKDKYENIGYSWQIRLNNTKEKNAKLIKTYYLMSNDEERDTYSKKFRIDDINLASAQNVEYNETNEKLLRWCRILCTNSRDEIIKELGDKLMDKKSRDKLLEEVEENSRDEEVYDIYEKYSTYEMEREAEISEAVKAAVEKNTREVTEEVTKEVTKNNAIQTAKKMLKDNLDKDIISKYTGLTKKEIQKLL